MRLIDANALLDVIGEEPYNWTDSETEITELSNYRYYTALINAAPTVEIIHCVNCKYYEKEKGLIGYCWINGTRMCEADFCSYGEPRKDGEGE